MTKFAAQITAAAVAVIVMAVPATAQDVVHVSRGVAYGDLDLASPEGVDELNGRIRSVARAVCGVTEGIRDIGQLRISQRCMKEAVSEASAKVARAVASAAAAQPKG